MFEVAEYKVSFWHQRYTSYVTFYLPEPKKIKDRTLCSIVPGGIFDERVMGEAYCLLGDNFSRNEGRKISLRRALDRANFDKPTRTLFWKAYFKKRGKVG